MSDDFEDLTNGKFLRDLGAKLIERDLLSEEYTKIGLVLANVIDATEPEPEDTEEVREYKSDLLSLIITYLMYGHVATPPDEQEIDQEVTRFADWLKDAKAEFTQEEDPNGNS